VSVVETERLVIRRLTDSDAPFIMELVNDPDFLHNIGDRGVRNLEDAVRYIQAGPIASYDRHGFGLFKVELKEGGIPVGMCGLLKRDVLPDVDIGYAFLPDFRGRGLAAESAGAVLAYARDQLAIPRVVAIVSPGNHDSIRLLTKLGMAFERPVRLAPDDDEIDLFGPRPGGPMHPNAALLDSFYRAFQRRDSATMAACYAPDATFSDPVFSLKGPEVGAMWRMLCERGTDLRVEFADIEADDATGSAAWSAWYTFSGTARPVHNQIRATFRFQDGRIVEHADQFDLYRWAAQALGLRGMLLGWTPLVQGAIRRNAAKALARFMKGRGPL
jgi:RimJ/RimL family protein N-acetyltransferase